MSDIDFFPFPPPFPPDFVVRPLPDFWEHIFPFFGRCRQRVLVVTDSLNFGSGGFGLSRFLAELDKAVPAPIVTTQVHNADPGAFKFDGDGSVTTDNYDQIWLFGANGPALTTGEVNVIGRFMEAGGGVFATGDHQALGKALCGDLPRVRKMRNWETVPMEIERIDTVTNPGRDLRTQFDDQSDRFPQRIFPVYYGSGSTWAVHPLLRSPIGDVDVLPDHPHESVCLVGTNLFEDYTLHGMNLDEFPDHLGQPLAPEIVAWSVSAGRYLNPPGTIVGKPPTTPRLFGAISAWDGHRVRRGRVVCDATWHHFVNINLDGTDAVPAPAPDHLRTGLRNNAGHFTRDFHQIAQYYRNVLDWLTPSNRRWCLWWIDLILERYQGPLFEEFVPLPPHPCPWDPRVVLGAQVDAALEARLGPGFSDQIVVDALDLADLAGFAGLLRPLASDDQRAKDRPRTLFDHVELRRGFLGSVADALLRDLPATPAELPDHLREHDDGELERVVGEAVRTALDAARDHYRQVMETTLGVIGG